MIPCVADCEECRSPCNSSTVFRDRAILSDDEEGEFVEVPLFEDDEEMSEDQRLQWQEFEEGFF